VIILMQLMQTIIFSRFFKIVSKPLLQLSELILNIKDNKRTFNDENLDDIAKTLVRIYNDMNFSLRSSKKDYSILENKYASNRNYVKEQNEHLKTVLHDIKSPLAAIRTSSYILSEASNLDDSQVQLASQIEASSNKAHDYIVDTLKLVIGNIYDIYEKKERVDVLATVEDIYTLHEIDVINNKNQIKYLGSEKNIDTNILKFNHLLSNIVYNSIKYSQFGSEIVVELGKDCLQITNDIATDCVEGNGYGLTRVLEIAKELELKVTTNDSDNKFVVKIEF
ncbi:MAG: histidine kinase dimerization/phospho-acceptor domain-containing protein, partial [Bacilli bacterium]